MFYIFSYILNRGWIDKSERRLPTYKEITSKSKGKAKATSDDDISSNSTDGENDGGDSLVDEEEFDDVADYFESTYNFRFEEPYVSVTSFPVFPVFLTYNLTEEQQKLHATREISTH